MSAPGTDPTVVELVASTCSAAPDQFSAQFTRLVDAVWKDGALTGLAPAAVAPLVERLGRVGSARRAHLAVLLGLLIEAEHPVVDGETGALVAAGAPAYLEHLRAAAPGSAEALAVTYLLAHVPAVGDETLAIADAQGIGAADRSLLARAVQAQPAEGAVIGRVFPSPAEWALDADMPEFDARITARFSAEQVQAIWHNDTRTVLGNLGAKAWWTVSGGTPEVLPDLAPQAARTIALPPAGPGAELFAGVAEQLRCPRCRGGLAVADPGATCGGECGATFPVVNGVVNFFAEAGSGGGADDDFLRQLSEVPTMGLFYEEFARPAFLRLCGQNWGGAVQIADEEAYITEHVAPVDGPVLDLAAGAGRWTEMLAAAVGTERLIALDVNPSMTNVLRGRLPRVPAVLAGGDTLPFADASLGAVMCWNALQAFPHHAEATIAEVGRCLRPGGTFTVLTFRRPDDAIYRYFQYCHLFPQHTTGLELFPLDELKGWFAAAGLTISHESYPGTFVLVTAVKEEA